MSVADVIRAHLGLNAERSLVYAEAVRAAALAEDLDKGEAVAARIAALHRALDDAQAALPPGDPDRDRIARIRERHPRLPDRTGHPWAWGRRRVWPLLAVAWREAHPAKPLPISGESSFTRLVCAVHRDLGRADPAARTLARAAKELREELADLEGLDGLAFWTRVAPVYAQLAAIYER